MLRMLHKLIFAFVVISLSVAALTLTSASARERHGRLGGQRGWHDGGHGGWHDSGYSGWHGYPGWHHGRGWGGPRFYIGNAYDGDFDGCYAHRLVATAWEEHWQQVNLCY